MNWTDEDVQLVARACVQNRIPPLEIMQRLGPDPGPKYFDALRLAVFRIMDDDELYDQVRGEVQDMERPL